MIIWAPRYLSRIDRFSQSIAVPMAAHPMVAPVRGTRATFISATSPGMSVSGEPWHGLRRQMYTGGLRCPDLMQRCRAFLSIGGVVRFAVS